MSTPFDHEATIPEGEHPPGERPVPGSKSWATLRVSLSSSG